MYIEFALELAHATHRAYGPDAGKLLGIALDSPALDARAYSVLEVDRPPPQISGQITTALCFKLAKQLIDADLTTGDAGYGPVEVAQKIIAEFSQEKFSLEIGGGGHINAVPQVAFRKKLLTALASAGDASGFFSGGSFFSAPVKQTISWELDAAFTRLRALGDPQAILVLDRAAASGAFEDRLMTLSLLADEEIDAKIYLQGLFGRQNTPWYVQRFFEDSRKFESECDLTGEKQKLYAANIELLLDTRHELFNALRFHREERFLRHVLQLIRGFYRVFHDPRVRRAPSAEALGKLSGADPLDVFIFHRLQTALVAQSLECMFGNIPNTL